MKRKVFLNFYKFSVTAGLDFGLSEQDILQRLQSKLQVSLQVAQEYFKMFGK